MQRGPALGGLVLLEHREIDNPEWLPALGNHVAVLANLDAQCAQGIVDDTCLVGAKEHQVSGFGPGAFEDGLGHVLAEELENR